MSELHIIVCEDEVIYQKTMREKIDHWVERNHHEGVKIVVYNSSEDFLEQWEKGLKADILFLDILFHNEITGMGVAKQIRLTDSMLPIVFVTNSEAFVKEGYAVRAF